MLPDSIINLPGRAFVMPDCVLDQPGWDLYCQIISNVKMIGIYVEW